MLFFRACLDDIRAIHVTEVKARRYRQAARSCGNFCAAQADAGVQDVP